MQDHPAPLAPQPRATGFPLQREGPQARAARSRLRARRSTIDRRFCVAPAQQAVVLLVQKVIALAGNPFQTVAVGNPRYAPRNGDEALTLEFLCRFSDGRAADPEHLREELLRKFQVFG